MPSFSELLQWLATPSCVRKRHHHKNLQSSHGVSVATASQNNDVVESFDYLRCCDAGEPYESGSGEWLIELVDLDKNRSVVSLDHLRIEYSGFGYRLDGVHSFVEANILCGERSIKKDLPYAAVKDRSDYKPANVEWCF